jgi:hypothetical protein
MGTTATLLGIALTDRRPPTTLDQRGFLSTGMFSHFKIKPGGFTEFRRPATKTQD